MTPSTIIIYREPILLYINGTVSEYIMIDETYYKYGL